MEARQEESEHLPQDSRAVLTRPILQRACNGCIKAKRKCSCELPQCSRCRARGQHCLYANQPLTRPTPIRLLQKQARGRIWPLRLPQEIGRVGRSAFRQEDMLFTIDSDERSVSFLRKLLTMHPTSFSQTGRAIFIHPGSMASPLLQRLRAFLCITTDGQAVCPDHGVRPINSAYIAGLDRVIRSHLSAASTLSSYLSILPFVQGLVLIQILTLFVIPLDMLPSEMFQQAVNRQHMLDYWARKLWQSAPAVLPGSLTAYQSYSVAESIRRTLLVTNELRCLWDTLNYGYFSPSAFTRTLVFDRRVALWDLPERDFNEITGSGEPVYDAQEQTRELISYREYINMFDSMTIESLCGEFDTMLIVGARGLNTVEERLHVILT